MRKIEYVFVLIVVAILVAAMLCLLWPAITALAAEAYPGPAPTEGAYPGPPFPTTTQAPTITPTVTAIMIFTLTPTPTPTEGRGEVTAAGVIEFTARSTGTNVAYALTVIVYLAIGIHLMRKAWRNRRG